MFRSQVFCSLLTDESARHAGRRTCFDNGMRRTPQFKISWFAQQIEGGRSAPACKERKFLAQLKKKKTLKRGQMGTFERQLP